MGRVLRRPGNTLECLQMLLHLVWRAEGGGQQPEPGKGVVTGGSDSSGMRVWVSLPGEARTLAEALRGITMVGGGDE